MKTFIIILILANCALSSQVLDIDFTYESKLYFSIGTNISYRYYGDLEYYYYTKKLKSYFLNNIDYNPAKDELFAHYSTLIELPDNLMSNEIEIKENMYAMKVDFEKRFTPFEINNHFFISTWGDGDVGIKFDVPDALKKDRSGFYILAENRKYLDQIEVINPEQISDQTLRKKMTDLMKNFFENNIKIFEKQITYLYLKDNNLDLIKLLADFENIFQLDFLSLKENNVIVLGEFIGSRPYRFLALINLENENVDFHQHRIFNGIFNFEDELFIFSKSYGPNTGANCYNIDIVKKDGLKPVFRDGSFSM